MRTKQKRKKEIKDKKEVYMVTEMTSRDSKLTAMDGGFKLSLCSSMGALSHLTTQSTCSKVSHKKLREKC